MGLYLENIQITFRNESGKGFEFERVNPDWWRYFIANNYFTIAIVIGSSYLGMIYFGQKIMKSKSPLKVNRLLVIWNMILAFIATAYFYRGFDLFLNDMADHGAYKVLCQRLPTTRMRSFWGLGFLFSKIFELGDTAFLILKKKPVKFIHCYHHLSVVLSGFYIYTKVEPVAMLSSQLNSFIHSILYTYFAASNFIKLPHKFKFIISTLEILHIVLAYLLAFTVLVLQGRGYPCILSYDTLLFGSSLAFVYLGLFIKYYIQKYFPLKKEKKN